MTPRQAMGECAHSSNAREEQLASKAFKLPIQDVTILQTEDDLTEIVQVVGKARASLPIAPPSTLTRPAPSSPLAPRLC